MERIYCSCQKQGQKNERLRVRAEEKIEIVNSEDTNLGAYAAEHKRD